MLVRLVDNHHDFFLSDVEKTFIEHINRRYTSDNFVWKMKIDIFK